jgi:hypothetical protein
MHACMRQWCMVRYQPLTTATRADEINAEMNPPLRRKP